MRNLLFVSSSLMGENSTSRKVAGEIFASLQKVHGYARVTERHLTPANSPHLTLETLGALGAAADKRTADQQAAVDYADSVIGELEQADTIVLAVPMYNFTIPSTLKAWLDHVARAGRTFRYTAEGPVGLLKGKKVYVVASRGGFYGEGTPTRAADFQEPYLRQILGFVGLTDVTFVYVEGQAISPDVAAKGVEAARSRVAEIVPLHAAA